MRRFECDRWPRNGLIGNRGRWFSRHPLAHQDFDRLFGKHRTLITPWKPSKAQILAARDKLVPDLAGKNLIVLFVGINPGLYTAAIGHHFGRPGNRFWPALYGGGFTPRLFSPFEESLLLDLKFGITNIVERATARADELSDDELRAGGRRLQAKVRRWRPTVVAFVGIHPYRVVSGIKNARVGLQKPLFGNSHAWVLPNPSGLNAHYLPAALAQLFGDLRLWAIAEHERRRRIVSVSGPKIAPPGSSPCEVAVEEARI